MRTRTAEKTAAGLTLVELLMVLVVGSIIIGFGIPALSQLVANNRMVSSVNDFVTDLHLARSEAVKRRTPAAVCAARPDVAPNVCNAGAGFHEGWVVFVDENGNGQADGGDIADGGEVVRQHFPLPGGIQVTCMDRNDQAPGGQQLVVFDTDGSLLEPDPGTGLPMPMMKIQFCDDRGDAETGGGLAAGRYVGISATGRPQTRRRLIELQDGAVNPLGGCG